MVEIDEEYCLYAQKRLALAENDASIQGYADGVFWERNARKDTHARNIQRQSLADESSLFAAAGRAAE